MSVVADRSILSRSARWLEGRRDIEIVMGLYGVAVFARLLVALLAGIDTPFVSDAKEYFSIASWWAQGKGYSRVLSDGMLHLTAKRVPGTSLVLALGILVFGQHYSSGRLVAVLVGSCSAPLLFLFARSVAPRLWAMLAGLAGGLYPSWVFHSTNALSETFLVPFLLLALLLTIRAVESKGLAPTFYAGLAWGATILFRPTTLPMAGLVAIYMFWRGGWKHAVLLGAGFVLLLTPWVVRNKIDFGHPLLATQGGEAFLGANNPYVVDLRENHGMWVSPMEITEYRAKLWGILDEVRLDKLEYQISFEYLRRYPGVIPRLVFYKLYRWLTPVTESGGVVRFAVLGSYGALLLLLFIGIFLGIYERTAALELVVLWSFVLFAMTVAYWGILTRGRMLLELVWIPWAALTVSEIIRRWYPAESTQSVTVPARSA